MTFRYYRDLTPTFSDRSQWALPTVLRHHAAERPDAVWLDAPEESATWTYAEMLASAERVGRNLLDQGAEKGDRVVLVAQNSSRFVRTWVGSAVAGLVEVPINTAYEHDFLAHQVRTVEAKLAVVDDVFAERFVAVKEAASDITKFWVIDTGQQDKAIEILREAGWDAAPWDELEAELPAGRSVELPDVQPQDLASVLFTSGTTGPSKGVAMPHAQMYFFADECVSLVRLTPDDAWMTVTPLFHGNAQFMAAYPTMVAGARCVIRSKFSASRWVDQIRESRVSVTNFIGVMMDFIWKQDRRSDDADNPLRVVFAAPTAATLVEPMKERYGIEAFVEVFGLTETSAPIISPYGESRPAGAAGLAADEWFDVALVDPETDEEVAVGEIGELVIRPKVPFICSMGYYNMPEKTVEAWRNLWFHTGDALRRDEDGWFYFVDRFKDALRRRGENISSYEIETSILSHPAVVETAVIAVPASTEAGEDEVMAYVITQSEVTAEELWEHCDGRIPSFAVPRYLRFVDELPKTPSQRVQKAKLRELGVTDDTHDRTPETR
ncbi:AMP-binding protein [Nocardioides daphniae]|uniref:ATP-dependent acyl-CoA ligase n=1 Tax=Nocardioides daphniae TaxID=402297 RepID=A0A4P7U8I9_9ACTN|nr:AMP-binding protein [Nocardioides daphniae]QCC76462.1 ATP-dependent acyl-CoA ligase [Nocardioides daphniae]GGD06551.1 ATP-dependent acyl-CoA ligase [Nocardioides daphniae]